jgi:hypothetical protein
MVNGLLKEKQITAMKIKQIESSLKKSLVLDGVSIPLIPGLKEMLKFLNLYKLQLQVYTPQL